MTNIINDLIEQLGEPIKSFTMFKFFPGIKTFVNQAWKKDRDRETGKPLEDL